MAEELHYATVSTLGSMLEKGEISSVELTQTFIDRTRKLEPQIGSFLSVDEAYTLNQAQSSDQRRTSGKTLGPLDGIPVSIKDNIAEANQPMTCASKILKGFISPYDATVIQKLKASGAVTWGRTNLDEFAMGSSTETSAFQVTNNPWDIECTPGGSSGGSASSVAAGETPLSLGSDTGGSIRQPASLCGIVGIKPTYGLVSRYGLTAYASSLDQVGPLARTVTDAALLLQAIAGHDPHDSTSYKLEVPDYLQALKQNRGPWTLGVPQEYFAKGLHPEVRAAIEKAIQFYEAQGYTIEEVSLPNTSLGIATYYIIAPAEASSNLARFDGVRYGPRSEKAENAIDLHFKSREEGFGAEVKRRIILGTYVLSSGYYDAYYIKAQKVRALIRNDFEKAFTTVDAILTPTAPNTAWKKGAKTNDPLSMYLEDVYTLGANLAGIPGISIPCGLSASGLPIGLQLLGKPFKEDQLLSIAHAFEQAHDFKNIHPKL